MDDLTLLAAKAAALRMKVAADDVLDAPRAVAQTPFAPVDWSKPNPVKREPTVEPEVPVERRPLPFAPVSRARPMPFGSVFGNRAGATEPQPAGEVDRSALARDPGTLLRKRVLSGLRNLGGKAAKGFHNFWTRSKQQ